MGHSERVVTIFLALLVLHVRASDAQHLARDTTYRFFVQLSRQPSARRAESVVVDTPTVLAVVPGSSGERPDSTLRTAQAAVERLGYVFRVVSPDTVRRIVDRRHAAVYQLPRTLRAGYVIMAPSRRPRFVPGLSAAGRLAREIGEYERLVHHLTLR